MRHREPMRIVSDLTEFQTEETGTAVAIGKFDGVHLGHRKLLERLVEKAAEERLTPVVFTFNPPPAVLFGGADAAEDALMSAAEKREIFAALGVGVLVEFPFTRQTAATPPEQFVREILVGALRAELVVCGEDVSFGAGGRGDLALLRAMSESCGFRVAVVEKLTADGAPISSTRIRQTLRAGREDEARALLGRATAF